MCMASDCCSKPSPCGGGRPPAAISRPTPRHQGVPQPALVLHAQCDRSVNPPRMNSRRCAARLRLGGLPPFRSGLYHLLRAVPGVGVIPIGLSYDLLLSGRQAAFVRVGRPLTGRAALPRQETERLVRHEVARLSTVTLARLIGVTILNDLDPRIALGDGGAPGRRTSARAADLTRAGYAVDDRMLQRATFRRRGPASCAARAHGPGAAALMVRLD